MIRVSKTNTTLIHDGRLHGILSYDKKGVGINSYETITTNHYGEKTIYAYFPKFINRKIIWLKEVTVKTRLIFNRYIIFANESQAGGGINDTYYDVKWSKWFKKWEIIKN